MPTNEQLLAWLNEAETAKHNLVTLKKAVRVDYNGRSVTYNNTAQDLENLNKYIAELKMKLNGGRRRAGRVVF